MIHSKGWCCWVGGKKSMQDVGPLVWDQVHGETLQEFLATHKMNCLWVDAFALVDWPAVQGVLARADPLFKLWVSKHMSKFCGVS